MRKTLSIYINLSNIRHRTRARAVWNQDWEFKMKHWLESWNHMDPVRCWIIRKFHRFCYNFSQVFINYIGKRAALSAIFWDTRMRKFEEVLTFCVKENSAMYKKLLSTGLFAPLDMAIVLLIESLHLGSSIESAQFLHSWHQLTRLLPYLVVVIHSPHNVHP